MSDLTHMAQTPTEPPLQDLSSTNHGPWLVVCAYIFLILALTSIFIKLFTRYKFTSGFNANDMYIISSGVSQANDSSILLLTRPEGVRSLSNDRCNDSYPLRSWSTAETCFSV
jgi:hypothetical protein